MLYELTGVIHTIGDVNTYGNDFRKQELLVETEEREHEGKKYSEIVKLIVTGKMLDQIPMYSIGEQVKVGFALGGRMWQSPDKGPVNFTELKLTWIQKEGVQPQPQAQQVDTVVENVCATVEEDDLPF